MAKIIIILWLAITAALVTVAISDQIITVNLTVAPPPSSLVTGTINITNLVSGNLTLATPPSSLVSGFINITNVGSGNLTLAKPPSSLVSGYTKINNLGSGNLTLAKPPSPLVSGNLNGNDLGAANIILAKPPSSLVSGSFNITNVANLTGNTGSAPAICGANVVGVEGCGKLTPGNLQINVTVTNITLSVNVTATPGVPIKFP